VEGKKESRLVKGESFKISPRCKEGEENKLTGKKIGSEEEEHPRITGKGGGKRGKDVLMNRQKITLLS